MTSKFYNTGILTVSLALAVVLIVLALYNTTPPPQPVVYPQLTNLQKTCLSDAVYYFTGTIDNPQTLAPMFEKGIIRRCKTTIIQ
jgi:hypothetical protein